MCCVVRGGQLDFDWFMACFGGAAKRDMSQCTCIANFPPIFETLKIKSCSDLGPMNNYRKISYRQD